VQYLTPELNPWKCLSIRQSFFQKTKRKKPFSNLQYLRHGAWAYDSSSFTTVSSVSFGPSIVTTNTLRMRFCLMSKTRAVHDLHFVQSVGYCEFSISKERTKSSCNGFMNFTGLFYIVGSYKCYDGYLPIKSLIFEPYSFVNVFKQSSIIWERVSWMRK